MGPGPIVVLDTNVLVSALGWRGPERRAYELSREGVFRQLISRPLLQELRRVLEYPKLGVSAEAAVAFVSDLQAHATLVEPTVEIDVIQEDPPDNRVLECALEGGARWIGTGDSHLLKVAEFRGVGIVTAAELLKIIAN